MSEMFDAVDALVASRSPLPPAGERKRLRVAHGLTLDVVAATLKVRPATVSAWESTKKTTEPRGPEREAYARMLKQLAELYPAPMPATFTGAPATAEAGNAKPSVPATPDAAPRPARPTKTTSTSRRPGARKAAPASTPARDADQQFENGPLAVVDADEAGQVVAYCVGGLVLDVPAKSLSSLVDWALTEAKLGALRLTGPGRDADPLLVLTEAALIRYGLPARLSREEQRAGRLPEGHKVVKQLARAQWKLTKRGLGPWARIYRPADGSARQCVQLCIPSWDALDTRSWGQSAQLPPPDLAHVLSTYATRVLTPCGSTAVCGVELMTALHPPTRASKPDEEGQRHSEHNPGSLGKEPIPPAPCEAPDGHPLLADLPRHHQRGPDEMLFEEAYDWARRTTDSECENTYVVGIDINLAFAAAANGAVVGLTKPPEHVIRPAFDPKTPGSWLVDLSHVDLSRVKIGKKWTQLDADRLPSPFTPEGTRPTGLAWYATPTVAYAQELGYEVSPREGWLRRDSGRYLDAWYTRLRDAYLVTMADLGVHEDLTPHEFLTAMEHNTARDPQTAAVLSAVKATVKGALGKLRERPRDRSWRPGQEWAALSRPTWRPDIRATVISRTRTGQHRKILRLAAATGRYPIAILSDCAVYPADGPSPLDVLPYTPDHTTLPGSFRIGVNPGLVKHEGTQPMWWAEQARDDHGADLNLARYIKDGIITADESDE